MAIIPIDSYGGCHKNRDIPIEILEKNGHDQQKTKVEVFKNYTFGLAFENSNCYDYVTEKIFDVLAAGAIPIYMGAPNVDQYVPPNSYIDVRWFTSAAELVGYLHFITSDLTNLMAYHNWRTTDPEKWFWPLNSRAGVRGVCDAILAARGEASCSDDSYRQ